jgi:glycosidase
MNRFACTVVFLAVISHFPFRIVAQQVQVERVEPPSWWIGMNNKQLQVLVYGDNVGLTAPRIQDKRIKPNGTVPVDNVHYLFVNLTITDEAPPGTFSIELLSGDTVKAVVHYELRQRRPGSAQRKGFDQSDVIYLLMPDRFANGDTTNDNAEGMTEKCDRSNPDGRHGGDLQGVAGHLDYIAGLGVTTLWMNPFVENNNPKYSYHGYAITDFYRADPRIGSNEQLVSLVKSCHDKGLKVIMDQILNHASKYHWLFQDPPSPAWIHTFDEFTRTNYRASTIVDPYASNYDRNRMLTGWFDTLMPDLDQRDPLLLNYFIQNSIWWVEYADLDGIRLDTQPYPYKEATAVWSKHILEEYPNFNIVGEAWMQEEAFTAYFQKDSPNPDGYNSNIPTVTDFPRYFSLIAALNEKEGWNEGMARIFLTQGHDYLYGDPDNKLIFCDNHDLNRFYSSVGKDLNKFKMGLVYLFTTNGIPMLYYGTEILMTGLESQGHGFIRTDFPGGWPQDTLNAFTQEGRTGEQNEAFEFIHTLLEWRKTKEVVHSGKLIHFVPEKGIYVYFRMNEQETVMVVLNNEENEQVLSTTRFAECIKSHKKAVDAITGRQYDQITDIHVPAKSGLILELE